MNREQTERYIEQLDAIMNMMENFSPHKFPPGNSVMWIMLYDMLIKTPIIMQTMLYNHLDNLIDAETNQTPPTLDTHTAVDD